MVDARRLKLLTSAGSTVRVPILGAACMYLPVPSTSSRYVQDGPTTGWKLLGGIRLSGVSAHTTSEPMASSLRVRHPGAHTSKANQLRILGDRNFSVGTLITCLYGSVLSRVAALYREWGNYLTCAVRTKEDPYSFLYQGPPILQGSLLDAQLRRNEVGSHRQAQKRRCSDLRVYLSQYSDLRLAS